MKQYFLKDAVVNSLLGGEEYKDYVAAIISEVLGMPYETIKSSLKIRANRINTNINRKNSIADNMYSIYGHVINIEINYTDTKESKNKNMRYVFNLILDQVEVGDKDIYEKVIQININNYDFFKKGKFIYHSTLREEKNNLKRSDLFEIYDINMEFLREMSYNQIKKIKSSNLKRLLYVLICEDKEKREELYKGDEIMEKVNDGLFKLTEDGVLYYDYEEFHNREAHELGMTKGLEEGMKKGLEQGRKETLKEIIFNLYNNQGKKVEEIATLINISKESVSEIIEENIK